MRPELEAKINALKAQETEEKKKIEIKFVQQAISILEDLKNLSEAEEKQLKIYKWKLGRLIN